MSDSAAERLLERSVKETASLETRGPKTRRRVRRYGLMMLDVEIFDELGILEKLGRRAFAQLDKPLPNRRRFPQPITLFGGRRFWPAVERYLMEEFGGALPDYAKPSAGTPTWEEHFDEAS